MSHTGDSEEGSMTDTHPASTTEMWEQLRRDGWRSADSPIAETLQTLRTRMEELEQERDVAREDQRQCHLQHTKAEAVIEAARELGLASKPESWACLDDALSSYDQGTP